jgi:methyl-accepting chemotaxis protein
VNLKDQISKMADQFSEKFGGASDGLVRSVQSFQPTVEALSGAVGDAQLAVANAVAKLISHESVMAEMAGAAVNIRQASEAFGAMNETLTVSAARNEEASKAQFSAAQSNERVAEQFGKTSDRWPEIQKALEDAAHVMGSLDAKLKEQIGSMANQFSDRFSGASDGLLKSVQGFQPTVEALSGAVGDAQRAVADAVAKLNSHETVMKEMAGAAVNIREASEAFGAMNETLTLSAARNEEASKAQLSAAQSNERVAEQFGRIGEGLPKISETVEAAARVIGSLGSPIRDLQALLEGQPELQRQIDTARSTSESERSQLLLSMAGNLAEKVGIAAQQFAEVGALADKLTASATSLEGASSELAVFGQQVVQASKDQRDASEASRAAAASGERAAKAFEPLPEAFTALAGGLTRAGTSVRDGAEKARDSYRELIELQKQWFAGAELGLKSMEIQLQTIINSYGGEVEGKTKKLMKDWTEAVAGCLQSYETQVSELQGGLDELQSAISKLNN